MIKAKMVPGSAFCKEGEGFFRLSIIWNAWLHETTLNPYALFRKVFK
jgi:hypothetical protein